MVNTKLLLRFFLLIQNIKVFEVNGKEAVNGSSLGNSEWFTLIIVIVRILMFY